MPETTKNTLREAFDALVYGKYVDAFQGIERALVDWINSESSEAIEYINRIFISIQPNDNYTWYGFTNTAHPSHGEGVFVDKKFEVIE